MAEAWTRLGSAGSPGVSQRPWREPGLWASLQALGAGRRRPEGTPGAQGCPCALPPRARGSRPEAVTDTFPGPRKKKAYSTRYSQAVSHPSTNQARPCLASEIRRDRARSGWYGRRRRRLPRNASRACAGFHRSAQGQGRAAEGRGAVEGANTAGVRRGPPSPRRSTAQPSPTQLNSRLAFSLRPDSVPAAARGSWETGRLSPWGPGARVGSGWSGLGGAERG